MTLTDQQDIEALLPFYVNGTLGADDLARVEAALAASPALQDEVAVLREVRARLQGEMDQEAAQSPGALGLARLERDIRTERKTAWQVAPWQAGLMAASVAALAFAASSLFWAERDALYTPASGGLEEGALRPQAMVKFNPEQSIGAMNALLYDNGLALVSGPSALGIVQVASLDNLPTAEVVQMLKGFEGAVDFVSEIDD